MNRRKCVVLMIWMCLICCGCASAPGSPDMTPRGSQDGGSGQGQTKIVGSVLLAHERDDEEPRGYGLYSHVVITAPTENALLLLQELFSSTGTAKDSLIDNANLNLMLIPVKDGPSVQRVMADARHQPGATAKAVLYSFYDYGYAEWLRSLVCAKSFPGTDTGCGDLGAKGPFIITLDRSIAAYEKKTAPILVVDLSNTHPEAMAEVISAYKRQVTRKDFADRKLTDSWRLVALNAILNAADFMPQIQKAFAFDLD